MKSKAEINKEKLMIREKELSFVTSKVNENIETTKENHEKKLNHFLKLWSSTAITLTDLGFEFGSIPHTHTHRSPLGGEKLPCSFRIGKENKT